MQSSEFFKKSPSLEEKTLNSEQMRYSVGFFEGELQFHVRKEPQNYPKIVKKKKFQQLFENLVNFH